jgi:GWxTD domain-containing protein
MKLILVSIVCLLLSVTGFTQGQKLRVYLDTKQFYEPTQGSFVEINFQYVGHTLEYVGAEDGLKGEVAVLLDIILDQDTLVRDAYRLETPLMKDSIVEDFYDIRRFGLNPGKYQLHLQIFDLISNGEPVTGQLSFTILERDNNVSFGDVQNIEFATEGDPTSVFYKSGYEIIPRMSNYYPEQLTSLPYYTEIYNVKSLQSPEFGLKESVYNADTKTEIEKYTKIYRYKAEDIVPVLRQIDISELPTGNYYLSLSVIDSKMNEAQEKKYFFERTNNESFVMDENIALDPAFEQSIPKDSIEFYLASLIPIATGQTAVTILRTLKEKDDEKSLKLIQSFWLSTEKMRAYESWLRYKQQVLYTERLFSNTFKRGYESDRGRVYLQYGAPNSVIAQETSADEFPYEIWQYNQIGRASNKHFVFYNPDLIANNHQLLHSDLIGEIKNMNWPMALKYREVFNGDTDNQNTGMPTNFQDQNNVLFRQN